MDTIFELNCKIIERKAIKTGKPNENTNKRNINENGTKTRKKIESERERVRETLNERKE